jgi:hypothetical protein
MTFGQTKGPWPSHLRWARRSSRPPFVSSLIHVSIEQYRMLPVRQHPEFGGAGGGAEKDFGSTKPPIRGAGTDYPSVPDAAGR